MNSILVIGLSTQIGLEIVRSLGKKGISVFGADSSSDAIGFFSKYLKKKFVIPFAPESIFIENVINILKTYPEISAIIAISERNITVLNKHRKELEKRVKLLFPPQNVMDFALNKRKTFEIASSLGIPLPKTIFVDSFEEVQKAKYMDYPLIIKPYVRDYEDPHQLSLDFRVKYIFSFEELLKEMERYKSVKVYPMIQSLCDGEEIGFSVIMAFGEPRVCFQYLNYHLSPVMGGVPILRKSVAISSKIKEYSISLLKEINWEGVAELDWIKDHRDGEYKLLEINGRFWGGTPLPSRAGLPFPSLLYKALIENKRFYREDYKIGIKCCLLGGETKRLLEILRAPNGYFGFSKFKAIKEYLSLFIDPSSYFDIQSKEDPLPGIMDLWFMFKKWIGLND